MMPNPYSEDQLVEQPAIVLLEKLGWETLDCYGEFDQGVSALGRENKGEVVLTSRLRPALKRFNPDVSVAAVNAAIEELTKSRAAMNPVVANSEIYSLLKDGVRVTDTAPDDEGETVVDLKIIDWENPDRKRFLLGVTALGCRRNVHTKTGRCRLRKRAAVGAHGVQTA